MTDKVTRQCPQTTTFLKRKEAEAVSNRGPSAYQPTALRLGQTGSQNVIASVTSVKVVTKKQNEKTDSLSEFTALLVFRQNVYPG